MTSTATTIDELRAAVWAANNRLSSEGLVTLTWGNVSGASADGQVVAITPSGMPAADLRPEHMVVLSVDTGEVVAGDLRPSTDTATHLELYRRVPGVAGIVHAHSTHATAFAQARLPIPCVGTTHADHFAGSVDVTRPLTEHEVSSGYEHSTGVVIAEHVSRRGIDPLVLPAILVAGHAPFVWGPSPSAAIDNAVALEAVAHMVAIGTSILGALPPALEPWVLEAHNHRKHGPGAWYGQSAPPA
jgi:L-ribulose-5-phosphate 4-epimerase